MKKFLQKMVLTLTSFAFVTALISAPVLAASPTPTAEGFSTSMLNPRDGGITVPDNANTMIKNIITLVFVVAAVITFAYLIYGAISWITSGGDKSKVEAARNRITSAVIGLLILAATWAIFLLVMQIAFGQSTISIPSLSN